MDTYSMTYEVRWADIDANHHRGYSAYIDAATELRYRFFKSHAIPPDTFEKLNIGPVYTTLSVNFFREVRMDETLTINYQLAGLSPQGKHWKLRHDFLKVNNKKAVTLFLEGTFLDLNTRQSAVLTPEILAVFQEAPRASDFEDMSDSRWFNKPAIIHNDKQ